MVGQVEIVQTNRNSEVTLMQSDKQVCLHLLQEHFNLQHAAMLSALTFHFGSKLKVKKILSLLVDVRML